MMVEKSKVKWGNRVGYIIFPFSIGLQKDPLEYVRKAKATIDRKKHSFEASCSFSFMKWALNLFGVKVHIDMILYITLFQFTKLKLVEQKSFFILALQNKSLIVTNQKCHYKYNMCGYKSDFKRDSTTQITCHHNLYL